MTTPKRLEVILKVSGSQGPYDLMVYKEGATTLAWFAVVGLVKEGEEPIWVPTPLPKPLLENEALLYDLAEKLFDDGLILIQPKITIH